MSVHEMPHGRLRVRWRNAAGIQKSKTFTPKMEPDARKRRKMAQAFEQTKRREVAMGVPEVDTRKTLSRVVDDFVPQVIERKAPKTQQLYRSLWNAHIQPEFGSWPVVQIGAGDIEAWLAMFDSKKLKGNPGIVTQRKCLVLLGQMFRFAQKRGWCLANPVELVDRPKLPAREPVICPTPLEVEKIRKAFLDAGQYRAAMFVSIAAYAGLRPFSEALALTRDDVRDRTLLVRDRKRGMVRTVDILPPLREDLNRWLASPVFPSSPLLPNSRGDFWTRSQYENWRGRDGWAKVVSGMPPKTLRHTFVSLLLRDEGYTRREIADQAGHSMEVQDRVYSHVWAEMRGSGSAEGAIREARQAVFGQDNPGVSGLGRAG